MRPSLRAAAGAATVVAGLMLSAAGGASAQAQRTCTWGGTPLMPSGQNEIFGHGLTNTPSTQPLHFYATGPLGGQCKGTLVFDGIMDAGASCTSITFHANVFGLAGVATVEGTAVAGLGPARLYDRRGDLA